MDDRNESRLLQETSQRLLSLLPVTCRLQHELSDQPLRLLQLTRQRKRNVIRGEAITVLFREEELTIAVDVEHIHRKTVENEQIAKVENEEHSKSVVLNGL